MDSLDSLYRSLSEQLRQKGIENPAQDVRILLSARGGFSWADLISRPDMEVPGSVADQLARDVMRRGTGEPVSRILGEREFYGLSFFLGADTLDPRPDTETIVNAAQKSFGSTSPSRILDLGTGSGCILVSLLHLWPGAYGVGIDRAFGALCTARANAIRHAVKERADFICGDWGAALSGSFDLIVSNPPYIPNREIENLAKDVRNYDPILALDGGEDGLKALQEVVTEIKKSLASEGRAFVEIGFGQASEFARLVEKSGLVPSRIHVDIAGVERVFEIRRGDK